MYKEQMYIINNKPRASLQITQFFNKIEINSRQISQERSNCYF